MVTAAPRGAGYVCADCRRTYSEDALRWSCDCGGLLELLDPLPFTADLIDREERGPWRYAAALPLVDHARRVRLGEVRTPLVPCAIDGIGCLLKLDHLLPTGSYKDRGTAVMVSKLALLGVRAVMDDSSGNAGASLAAYSAAAGMRCIVITPGKNSPGKHAQIRAYGAELRATAEEDRARTVATLLRDLGSTVFYASHNRHPAFLAGVATLGFELWEDLGRRLPRNVVVPAGHGSVVLGLWRAFHALHTGDTGMRTPRIYAVQSASRPALALAWERGASDVEPAIRGSTIAEGIAAAAPTRGRAVLAALRCSGGGAIAVEELEIAQALRDLGRLGHYVEPTSAVAVAGLRRLVRDRVIGAADETVVVITGSGLKTAWPDTVLPVDRALGRTA